VTVLPELRAQVVSAAAARPARRRPRAEWLVGAAVTLAAAAVAFLALRHAPAPSPARLSPRTEQLRLFGVLRRAPTEADRTVQVERQPRSSPPADIRALAVRGARGIPVVVYTLRVSRPPLPGPPQLTRRNLLCVRYPDVDGAGGSCWTTAQILAGRGTAALGRHVFGLVPDGVATVRMTYPGGAVRTARVRENFFTVVAPGAKTLRGWTAYSPGAGSPITWLDAHGRRVGPGTAP
jgi:hypothetical protein